MQQQTLSWALSLPAAVDGAQRGATLALPAFEASMQVAKVCHTTLTTTTTTYYMKVVKLSTSVVSIFTRYN